MQCMAKVLTLQALQISPGRTVAMVRTSPLLFLSLLLFCFVVRLFLFAFFFVLHFLFLCLSVYVCVSLSVSICACLCLGLSVSMCLCVCSLLGKVGMAVRGPWVLDVFAMLGSSHRWTHFCVSFHVLSMTLKRFPWQFMQTCCSSPVTSARIQRNPRHFPPELQEVRPCCPRRTSPVSAPNGSFAQKCCSRRVSKAKKPAKSTTRLSPELVVYSLLKDMGLCFNIADALLTCAA